MEASTGYIVIQKVGDKSTVTRCFSKYPLKFILPNKVAPSHIDAVWIYSLTYGGGIVCGDCISCSFTVGDGCTAVFTTQASTKVYKSVGAKCSQQILEARVGSGSLLVVIPDPVTCFSTARYSQSQVFRVVSDSNLVLVDWFTSGRYELVLENLLLEQDTFGQISEKMQNYQVMAMVILLGPKLKLVQNEVQEDVKNIMSGNLHNTSAGYGPNTRTFSKLELIVSCSPFGPKGVGLIIRVASTKTEAVYRFLQQQLASLEPLIGVAPYCC
ncbi:hypothetical protein V2J09_022589 [Rumex salicifolius]